MRKIISLSKSNLEPICVDEHFGVYKSLNLSYKPDNFKSMLLTELVPNYFGSGNPYYNYRKTINGLQKIPLKKRYPKI